MIVSLICSTLPIGSPDTKVLLFDEATLQQLLPWKFADLRVTAWGTGTSARARVCSGNVLGPCKRGLGTRQQHTQLVRCATGRVLGIPENL